MTAILRDATLVEVLLGSATYRRWIHRCDRCQRCWVAELATPENVSTVRVPIGTPPGPGGCQASGGPPRLHRGRHARVSRVTLRVAACAPRTPQDGHRCSGGMQMRGRNEPMHHITVAPSTQALLQRVAGPAMVSKRVRHGPDIAMPWSSTHIRRLSAGMGTTTWWTSVGAICRTSMMRATSSRCVARRWPGNSSVLGSLPCMISGFTCRTGCSAGCGSSRSSSSWMGQTPTGSRSVFPLVLPRPNRSDGILTTVPCGTRRLSRPV